MMHRAELRAQRWVLASALLAVLRAQPIATQSAVFVSTPEQFGAKGDGEANDWGPIVKVRRELERRV